MKLVAIYILFSLILGVIGKKRISASARNNDDEGIHEMYPNKTPTPTTMRSIVPTDVVVEKFVDTLMASERYLKMIETVDRKLDRLDANFHEKTNSILKYLSEAIRIIKTSPSEMLEKSLNNIIQDLDRLKQIMTLKLDEIPGMRAEGGDYRDSNLDTRLTILESNLKTIMTGVDSIVGTISEVKNRQYSRSSKTELGTSTLDTMTILNEFRKSLHDHRTKKCDCSSSSFRSGRVDRSERYPTDCFEIQMQGFNISGIYKIRPEDMEPFYVLCDLNSAGGGWTVFQNRYDGSQDFYKGWSDYKNGFGNLAGEFWLGLEKLHYLTNQKLYEMRVEVETQHGQEAFAGYSVFTVGPEHEGFRISTLGTYYGSAGDSLTYHAGQKFSTPDMDNDEWIDGSCASEHGGAWWYKACDKSNLNGKYSTNTDEHRGQTMYWISFKGPNFPLTKTKMMIRPLPASKPVDFELIRKPTDTVRMKPMTDKKTTRKDLKAPYDVSRTHPKYRYEDAVNADAFFPNYA